MVSSIQRCTTCTEPVVRGSGLGKAADEIVHAFPPDDGHDATTGFDANDPTQVAAARAANLRSTGDGDDFTAADRALVMAAVDAGVTVEALS